MDKMPAAVRTLSEDEDWHTLEVLAFPFGGPFKGKDTYGTYFSAKTDFHWGLFEEPSEEPTYVRPLTYQHGFDEAMGLDRAGGWTPVRTDKWGVWAKAQLNKHKEYYEAIRELLDQDALGVSGGSAEHSVRLDRKSGEILEWPAYELALTPTPANPFAVIASRSDDIIRIVEAVKGEPPEDDPPEDQPPEEVDEGIRAGKRLSGVSRGTIQNVIDILSAFIADKEDEPDDAERTAADPVNVTLLGFDAQKGAGPGDTIDVGDIASRAAQQEVTKLLKK